MPITERVGHMALRVPDLDEAVDFHTHVLGLVETERNVRRTSPATSATTSSF